MASNNTFTINDANRTARGDAATLLARLKQFVAAGTPAWTLPSAVLLLLGSFLFLYALGDRELASSHEARAGQNAAVMLETGQWGLPRLFDEQLELQKPPLYYWMVALCAWLRGTVDAWAIRLPAALAALTCVILVFGLLWRAGRPTAGFIAACVLASCWHFTWLARVGRIDMPLTLAVTTALGCFFLDGASWRWRAGGYVAIGFGILLKGPIAAALVAAVALGMMILRDGAARPTTRLRSIAQQLLSRSFLVGAALVALIAAPWFVWANVHTGGQLWDVFFVHHNLERGFGSETLMAHPWWFYAARFWLDAFPWCLAAPLAGALVWRRRWWRDDPVIRLGAVWFVTVFLMLSLMRFKRADYLLPAFPGLALFLGAAAERWWLATKPRWALPAFGGILVSYALSWGIWLHVQDDGWPYQAAAAKIRAHAGADTPVIFFRVEMHPLAFHLRRPLNTIREWENLEIWANEPRSVYFVMPAECAAQWPEQLLHGRLEPVFPLCDLLDAKHGRDLVVLRNLRTQH